MAQAALIAGTALKVGGSILSSMKQAKALKAEAGQYRRKAGLERASAQRDAMEQQRQARLLESRALAVAAASGGGASDPTVVNTIANIAGEGEYRALTALYNGEEQALGLEAEATARIKEAKNVKTAGFINAASTLFSSASSFGDRYQ